MQYSVNQSLVSYLVTDFLLFDGSFLMYGAYCNSLGEVTTTIWTTRTKRRWHK